MDKPETTKISLDFPSQLDEIIEFITKQRGEDKSSFIRRAVYKELALMGLLPQEYRKFLVELPSEIEEKVPLFWHSKIQATVCYLLRNYSIPFFIEKGFPEPVRARVDILVPPDIVIEVIERNDILKINHRYEIFDELEKKHKMKIFLMICKELPSKLNPKVHYFLETDISKLVDFVKSSLHK